MKNMSKYIDIIRSCGYENFQFMPIRMNHIAEFYEYNDMFLKASPYNKNTRGFWQEYNMMKYIYSYEPNILPEPISFKDVGGIQMICMRKIEGNQLCQSNYNQYIALNIRNALQKMYNIKAIHGDIKADNILVKDNNEICLIDFDQSYIIDNMGDFELSPDIIGNEGRNLTSLIKMFKK